MSENQNKIKEFEDPEIIKLYTEGFKEDDLVTNGDTVHKVLKRWYSYTINNEYSENPRLILWINYLIGPIGSNTKLIFYLKYTGHEDIKKYWTLYETKQSR